jgi:hypothetical protein
MRIITVVGRPSETQRGGYLKTITSGPRLVGVIMATVLLRLRGSSPHGAHQPLRMREDVYHPADQAGGR